MFDTKTKRYSTPHAEQLAYLAALVAIEAPASANQNASTAKIPWELIDRIRELLAESGMDWRKAALERARVEHRRKTEEQERRYPARAVA